MKKVLLKHPDYRLVIDLFTEGEKTEIQYLRDFVVQQNQQSAIRLIHKEYESDPVNLVKRAICYVESLKLKSSEVPHQVWVIFDDDGREEKVSQALKCLTKYNQNHTSKPVFYAFMKPCIEIWALMHFKGKLPLKQKDAQNTLAKKMPTYHHQKNPLFDINKLTTDGYNKAVQLAHAWMISLDNPENQDSSSLFAGIYQLTEKIIGI